MGWRDTQPGKFVLVQFHTKSNTRKNNAYHYVCTVQSNDEEDGEVVVQGFKLINGEGNEFIVTKKTCVTFQDILQLLEEPITVPRNPMIISLKKLLVYLKNVKTSVFKSRTKGFNFFCIFKMPNKF